MVIKCALSIGPVPEKGAVLGLAELRLRSQFSVETQLDTARGRAQSPAFLDTHPGLSKPPV